MKVGNRPRLLWSFAIICYLFCEVTCIFSQTMYSVTEGEIARITIDISSSADFSFPLTVTLSYMDGSAVEGEDYTRGDVTVEFAPGENSASFDVPTIDDDRVEKLESFKIMKVGSSEPSLISPGPQSITTVQIVDNDVLMVSVVQNYTVAEGETAAIVVEVDSAEFDCEFSVTLLNTDDTAKSPGDYIPGPYVVNFQPGQRTVTLMVPTVDDSIAEMTEVFNVMIASTTLPMKVLISDRNTFFVEIEDSDVIVCSKAPENATVTEGQVAYLTIVCSGEFEFDFTLILDSMDDSAVAPGDYFGEQYAVYFPSLSGYMPEWELTSTAGQQSAILALSTFDDSIAEMDEVFKVMITGSDQSDKVIIVQPDTSYVTIEDNDVIVCSKAPENATVIESQVAFLTIVCSGEYEFDFTLNLDSMDDSAVAPDNYVGGPYSVLFTAGQQSAILSVTTNDDSIAERALVFKVMITGSDQSDKVIIVQPDTCYVTIVDENYGRPLPPRNFSVSAAVSSGAALNVTWLPPANIVLVVDYRIQYREADESEWQATVETGSSSATFYVIQGLLADRSYAVRIAAIGHNDSEGNYSAEVHSHTYSGPPVLECLDSESPYSKLNTTTVVLNFGCDLCIERGQAVLLTSLSCDPTTHELPINCTIRNPDGLTPAQISDGIAIAFSGRTLTLAEEIVKNPENPLIPTILGSWTCTCENSVGVSTATTWIGSCRRPLPPRKISVSAAVSSGPALSVTWLPPVNIVLVVDYRIQYREADESEWQASVETGSSSATFYVIEGLLANTSYAVRMAALGRDCAVGTYSAEVLSHTYSGRPVLECLDSEPAPFDPLVANIDFGCDLCIERGEAVFLTSLSCEPTTHPLPTNCTIRNPDGLTAAQISDGYDTSFSGSTLTLANEIVKNPENPLPPTILGTWTCTCENSVGVSTATTWIGSCLPPPPPRNVSVSAAVSSGPALNVTWLPPATINIVLVVDYRIQYRKVDESEWQASVETGSSGATFYVIQGLLADTSYAVRIAALGHNGSVGNYSAEVLSHTYSGPSVLECLDSEPAPFDPNVAIVIFGCDLCIERDQAVFLTSLSCEPTTHERPTNCTIRNPDGLTAAQISDGIAHISISGSTLSLVHGIVKNPENPLTPTVLGTWTCTCENSVGVSTATTWIGSCRRPLPPRKISVSAVVHVSSTPTLNVTWLPPANSVLVVDYRIQYREANESEWQASVETGSSSATFYVIQGLLADTSYAVRIAALGHNGAVGNYSAEVLSHTYSGHPVLECLDPEPVPFDPNVVILNVGCDFCIERGEAVFLTSLSCEPTTHQLPTNCTIRNPDGLTAAQISDGYETSFSGGTLTLANEIVQNPEDPLPPTMLGTWTCTCENSFGVSTATTWIGSCRGKLPPPMYVSVSAAVSSGPALNVTWLPPDTFVLVVDYRIQYREADESEWQVSVETGSSSATFYVIQGLLADTSYAVRIAALGHYGSEGHYSAEVLSHTYSGK